MKNELTPQVHTGHRNCVAKEIVKCGRLVFLSEGNLMQEHWWTEHMAGYWDFTGRLEKNSGDAHVLYV